MNLDKYRNHPRILELRFLLTHSNFAMEFGLENTAIIFEAICKAAKINWSILSSVIGRQEMVLGLSRTDRLRYRQEIVFMGDVYKESRLNVAKKYLRISKRLMYEAFDGMLLPQKFLNDEWLEKLDYNVVIAGNVAYSNELERFLNYLSIIGEVVTHVSMAKI